MKRVTCPLAMAMPKQQCPLSEAESGPHGGLSRIPVGAESWNMVGRQLLREVFWVLYLHSISIVFSGLFVLG